MIVILGRDFAGVKLKHAAYKELFDGTKIDGTKSRIRYRFPTNIIPRSYHFFCDEK